MAILCCIDLLMPCLPFSLFYVLDSVWYENVSVMPYTVKFNFDEVSLRSVIPLA